MKAVIVDDEPDCIKLLALQLKMCCPHIQVVGQFNQSTEALANIPLLQPDLVFLDIEMPRLNGFQLLEALAEINFSLVFVTAYDRFAVKAFRYSAVDYLLKPIDNKDLQDCVNKIERTKKAQLLHLQNQFQGGRNLPDKIALPSKNGVTFEPLANILYCEAENNYTRFILASGQNTLVSKTLGDIQDLLEERNFVRVHRHYLINIDHIKRYIKGEGNYLIMSNDASVPIARNQKEKLLEKFDWI